MLGLAVGKGKDYHPWGETPQEQETGSAQEVKGKEEIPSSFLLLHTSGLGVPLSAEPQGQLANQKPHLQRGIPSLREPEYRRVGLDVRGDNFFFYVYLF